MNKVWFVYIVTNYQNSVLYTGISNNIKRRIWEHKTGLVKNSFTKKYRLYKLVWFEEFNNPEEAIRIEKKIKGWKREKKVKLIKLNNPNFKDLLTLR
ncbi:MAG: GIY-YIG nuclease family protein [Patescibacteria group bacterium]